MTKKLYRRCTSRVLTDKPGTYWYQDYPMSLTMARRLQATWLRDGKGHDRPLLVVHGRAVYVREGGTKGSMTYIVEGAE